MITDNPVIALALVVMLIMCGIGSLSVLFFVITDLIKEKRHANQS